MLLTRINWEHWHDLEDFLSRADVDYENEKRLCKMLLALGTLAQKHVIPFK